MISSRSNSIFLIATGFSCKICEQLTTKKLNKWKTRNRVVSFRFFLSSQKQNISIFSQLELFFFFYLLEPASKPERSPLCTASSDNLLDFLCAGAKPWAWFSQVLSISAAQHKAIKHMGISLSFCPFQLKGSTGASKTRILQPVAGAQSLHHHIS